MKLVIFGSTGDLMLRKVLPALQELKRDDLKIYALGRKNLTTKEYREFICKERCFPWYKKNIFYQQIDFVHFSPKLKKLLEEAHIYLSLPPDVTEDVLNLLAELPKVGRILVEKPFGKNLEQAQLLQKLIQEKNLHLSIADHYLFKEGILDLKQRDFKKLEIVSLEQIGVEGRLSFYDKIGAMKDMVQGHFLNLTFKILESPDLLNLFSVKEYVRGQYGDGKTEGYAQDLGKTSETETFVKLRLTGKGKEILYITGKGFNKKVGYLKIDGEYFSLDADNSYRRMFDYFLNDKTELFPTLTNTLLAWRIIEKIDSKPQLWYYPRGLKVEQVLVD